ncbi:MAG: hypothetical protein ACJ763_09245 [Bdellovibrionia bacterium]
MKSKEKPKRKLPDIEVGSKVITDDVEPKEEDFSTADLTLTFNPYPAKVKIKKKKLTKR